MANSNKPNTPQILEEIRKNLALLIRSPIKGIKAAIIFVYVMLGTGIVFLFCLKLDWSSYNPFFCLAAYILSAILSIGGGYFLLRTCIKSDRRYI